MDLINTPTGGPSPLPNPMLSLRVYRRCFKGSKQLFAESDTAAASYYVINRIPHKHSAQWKPLFYRGDNPKYTPTSTVVGRARRTAMWGTFRVWLGDGMQELRDNEELRRKKRVAAWKNKWRRRFGKDEKPVEVVEEKPLEGKVMMFRMQRTGFLRRSVEFELEGVRYRWSGTRMFSTGYMKGVKGWSHCMKLIRVSDHALIATFEKGLLKNPRAIKTGQPPNKCKKPLGNLTLYHPPDFTFKNEIPQHDKVTRFMAQVDAHNTKPSDIKDDEKDLNPNGTHSGNILEEAIVFTCWTVVEAEHRLRYKIPEFFQEIAENLQE
ncbi:hypothetical protein BJY04DRAFT_218358 [Aspergillus karnatakaensis]|uniref:uncharacterized protein n=1 Tax=Aspergillus karnatakaensis TaxID=1810916 RepID=UPI003CCCA311